MTPEGYINVDEAAAKYGRNRTWWYRQLAEGNITGYEIPGIRGTFLRTTEIEAFLQPRPKSGKDGDETKQVG
jgi:hypothetical protein